VLKENPPETENGENGDNQSVRLIYRGKQLSSPLVTMGELNVKSGDKMMVLRRKSTAPSVSPDEVIYC